MHQSSMQELKSDQRRISIRYVPAQAKAKRVTRYVDCPLWERLLYRQFLLITCFITETERLTCWRQWRFAIA